MISKAYVKFKLLFASLKRNSHEKLYTLWEIISDAKSAKPWVSNSANVLLEMVLQSNLLTAMRKYLSVSALGMERMDPNATSAIEKYLVLILVLRDVCVAN